MQKIYYFLGNHFLKFCMILARIPGFWRNFTSHKIGTEKNGKLHRA